MGFVDHPLTNPRALKLAREFLSYHGPTPEERDRIYWINAQPMRNKLNQLAIEEPERGRKP